MESTEIIGYKNCEAQKKGCVGTFPYNKYQKTKKFCMNCYSIIQRKKDKSAREKKKIGIK